MVEGAERIFENEGFCYVNSVNLLCFLEET